jgi:hypothetical protein
MIFYGVPCPIVGALLNLERDRVESTMQSVSRYERNDAQ